MFRRSLLGAALAGAVPSFAQRGRRGRGSTFDGEAFPKPNNDEESRILEVIQEMAAGGGTWASVPASDGKLLRILAESAGAKHVVEVGTSTGYSGLFFALALRKTGGKLTTHEVDQGRADAARANFSKAGVNDLITLAFGNAHETVKQVKGPVDVLFLDADKDAYPLYLDILSPHVRKGGLILAHNTNMVPEYLNRIAANPAFDTIIYEGGGGMSVTLKKA